MCGRYTQTKDLQTLAGQFGFSAPETELNPRYNIAPGQHAPVVLLDPETGARSLRLMRWGLVPFWAKDEKIGNRLINARGETLHEKPSFKNALKRRRCLVLADGFYEWTGVPGGKQPYYIRLRSGRAFAFAGLWERWDRKDDTDPLHTFVVVTTQPNDVVRSLHDRMPVMLRADDEDRWLDPEAELDDLNLLLKPYSAEQMEAFPVSKQVNSFQHDIPQCILPIDLLAGEHH